MPKVKKAERLYDKIRLDHEEKLALKEQELDDYDLDFGDDDGYMPYEPLNFTDPLERPEHAIKDYRGTKTADSYSRLCCLYVNGRTR